MGRRVRGTVGAGAVLVVVVEAGGAWGSSFSASWRRSCVRATSSYGGRGEGRGGEGGVWGKKEGEMGVYEEA